MCLPHPPINNSLPWIEDSLNLTPILAILVRLATLAHLATLAPLATLATHVILATWPHCPCYRRCPADHSSLSILLSLALHPEGSSCLSFRPNPFSLPLILKLHPEGSFSFSSNRTPFRCPWSSNLQETLDLPSSRPPQPPADLAAPSWRKLLLFLPIEPFQFPADPDFILTTHYRLSIHPTESHHMTSWIIS